MAAKGSIQSTIIMPSPSKAGGLSKSQVRMVLCPSGLSCPNDESISQMLEHKVSFETGILRLRVLDHEPFGNEILSARSIVR